MTIRLHPKFGLNPKLTFCRRCGKETDELMLIGADTGKYKCDGCGMLHYGYPRNGRCQDESCRALVFKVGTIGEHEKLPSEDLCADCKKEIAEHKQMVIDGGVYWKCSKCGSSGVIRNSEFAQGVRKSAGVEAPLPVGVDFDGGASCPICSKKTDVSA